MGQKGSKKSRIPYESQREEQDCFSPYKSLFLKIKKEKEKEWRWRMRLKSHLAVYLLTPHCYIIKMNKCRYRFPDFIYFSLNSNIFPRAPGLCVIISRYLAITSRYYNLFHNFCWQWFIEKILKEEQLLSRWS